MKENTGLINEIYIIIKGGCALWIKYVTKSSSVVFICCLLLTVILALLNYYQPMSVHCPFNHSFLHPSFLISVIKRWVKERMIEWTGNRNAWAIKS